jgi:flagellar hook protein FlgE
MSISSSMNAGLSGLSAHANKLATISDNISNSQTYGYKRADADFASMAISQSPSAYTAGGVRSTTIRDIDAKGALVGSKNATDLAISGRGMLPVTSLASANAGAATPELMLTATGAFEPDQNGVLRTPSGLVLLGWPADPQGQIAEPPRDSATALRPVVINRSAVSAKPTTSMELSANLPASATAPDADLAAEFPISVEYFDALGASQTMSFVFRPVSDGGAPAAPVPNEWALEITDQASGTMLGAFDIRFDDRVGTGGAIETVTRTGGGAVYDGTTGLMSLDLGGGQTVEVKMGAENGRAPQFLSQLASVFSPIGVSKNGSGAGSFTGVTIDESGFLHANYSSGFSKLIYQIPVADVPNMDGLKALDNQAFAVSAASGPVYFWDAGAGPSGTLVGFAREQSTTDIGTELTQMIQTQRAYSSNAKIIQTVDEMLQETTNLKR